MKSFIEVCKNRAIAVLMLGHFTNDMFAGVLAIMYPILKLKFGLSNAEIGLVTLCYTSMVSLTQPIFGLVIDRKMRMWYPSVVILWGSVFVSLYGFAPTFAILMGCAAMAGLGSGAWHPMGATNVAVVTDPGHRNSSMSIYSVAGTLGYALGPIVTSVLLTMFGPEGTGFLVIPGVLASILIFRQMGAVAQARERRAALTANEASIHAEWGLVARIIGVTMLRSWVFLSVLQFTPLWFAEMGYSRSFYGPLTSVLILAGAAGTLFGGLFADRIGQKRIVISTLMLTIPAILLYAGVPGPISFLFAAVFGFFSDASLSVTLVMAQQLVPGRVGIATGLILGLGFVTGGIGVPITGRIADTLGIQEALMLLSVVAAASVVLAFLIPSDDQRAAKMRENALLAGAAAD